MNAFLAVFRREFAGYFRTPVAYVFLAVFLATSAALPWFVFRFYDSNDASLRLLFLTLPWVYLFLVPAVGMRLWAEERRSGTWELLLTLPLPPTTAVLAKFAAGWTFLGIALAGTATFPATVAYLGDPDWGPIVTGYLGALLMAGAYLGVCSLCSALTRNQIVSFVLGSVACFVLLFAGLNFFSGLLLAAGLPVGFVDAVANFSFLTHFETFSSGLVTVPAVVFFLGVTAASLALNVLAIER
jgi:ABC-2 type transport system permease protein